MRIHNVCNCNDRKMKALGKFIKAFCRCTYYVPVSCVEASCGEKVLSLCLLLPEQNEHKKNKLETPLRLSSPLYTEAFHHFKWLFDGGTKVLNFLQTFSAKLSVCCLETIILLCLSSPQRENFWTSRWTLCRRSCP